MALQDRSPGLDVLALRVEEVQAEPGGRLVAVFEEQLGPDGPVDEVHLPLVEPLRNAPAQLDRDHENLIVRDSVICALKHFKAYTLSKVRHISD